MGDGVLIYFGYPAAHEDDAERAVRAGLALIDAVAALPTPEPLQVRIGAATGMVVVGDLVGSGEAQERGIVGETPRRRPRRPGRTRRSSPSCCRFLTTDATPLWSLLPNSAGRRRLQHSAYNWQRWRAPALC